MFHVKQIINYTKSLPITDILVGLFVLSVPLQTRLILNYDDAFIGSIFSYHKAIFIYLSDLLFIAALVSWLIGEKNAKKALFYGFLPAILGLIALFHVEHKDLLLYSLVKLTEFWLIMIYVKTTKSSFHMALWLLIASGLLQTSLGIYQFHVQHGLNLSVFGEFVPNINDIGAATLDGASGKVLRAYGTFPHPNVFGGFLSIILAILLYVSRETMDLRKFLVVSCGTFLIFWGLLVSFSRSAWLAALIVVGVFLFHLILKKAYKQAIYWAILIIVSCGTLAFAYQDLVFPRTTESIGQSDALAYRNMFNQMGWETFKSDPLFGVGAGQLVPVLEQEYNLEDWQYQPPHNIALVFLAQYGIIGLITTFFVLFRLGFTWNMPNKLFVSLLLPAIIIVGSLDHYLITIQQGILLLAIILGLMLNKIDVSQRRETSI